MRAYLRRDSRVRADIEALLARFPMLATRRRDPAGTLSGGQQQILEMAIALLLHPRLLMSTSRPSASTPASSRSSSTRSSRSTAKAPRS